MFRHLRTKLTVLYAGLFAAILLLISLVALAAVSDDAQRGVRQELQTSGLVFQRVWAQRAAQFENDGVLLSHDFGFRSAVATRDDPTIRSALANLKARLGIDRAMLIAADGRVVSSDAVGGPDARLIEALKGEDTTSGVVSLNGVPYEVVSVPMDGSMTVGWLVFAARLDQQQMASLQSLAAIPLRASVAYRVAGEAWRDASGALHADPRVGQWLTDAVARGGATPLTLQGADGAAIALAKPLHGPAAGEDFVLLLQYPLAKAMAPYRALLALLLGAGALGLVALIVGTWAIARNVTRPISALEAAALSLRRGENAEVEVEAHDEIGRLAGTFNAMATEIRQRERERDTALQRAETANRAKSAFLANMSHEVRTPLNGVIGIAGVLSATPLDDKQQQLLGVIQTSADLLQRVLDDVLDVARIETGRLEIAPAPFDLGAALDAWASVAAMQCRDKGLAFGLAVAPEARVTVRGDRTRLEQVLGNLLSNAVKFTERGGVAVTVGRGAAGFRFALADTGVGFDPALAEDLFRPFEQADNSYTRKFGGTGLGLTICRNLAEAMGGSVTATGEPGVGATFTLEVPLPVIAAAAETDPDSEPAAAVDDEAAVRILVVDDHETNRQVAQLILTSVGAEVACAENGEQAVAAFLAEPFHVIFMDMQMPVMDGLTAIRTIRAHEAAGGRPRTPIMMLSANAMPEHVAASLAAGADDHVAKPITPPRLIAAVEKALALAPTASPARAAG